MVSHSWVLVLLVLLILSGCTTSAAPPVPTNTLPSTGTVDTRSPPAEIGPGDPLIFCDEVTSHDNEECFEDALVSCARSVAVFWTTSDGFPLTFESQGLDASGKCEVRVSVPFDSESTFAGKNAQCLIGKKTRSGGAAYFDAYDIGPSTCTGTYVDAIQKSAQEQTPPAVETPPVVTEPPVSTEKSFSFSVNESGVVGTTKEFVVNKGDAVTLNITVDTQDVSFNGEQVKGPAQNGLSADEYIIFTGHIFPGQTKSVTFTADESFEFGVYWPGSNVLKGKGKITVNP